MNEEPELTKEEQIRKEKVDKLLEEKEREGYKKSDLTMTVLSANLYAFLICIPICLLFVIPFIVLSSGQAHFDFQDSKYLLTLGAFIVSIVIHELIHGFFFGIFAKSHFKVIEFGVKWKALTPYCTCLEPVKKGQYLISCMMPGLILGIIPAIVSLFTKDTYLLLFGCLSILGAGGDFLICIKLLFHKTKSKDVLYWDHPYKVGLMVLEKEQ